MSLQGRLREGKKKEFVSSRNQSTPIPRTSSYLSHATVFIFIIPTSTSTSSTLLLSLRRKEKKFSF